MAEFGGSARAVICLLAAPPAVDLPVEPWLIQENARTVAASIVCAHVLISAPRCSSPSSLCSPNREYEGHARLQSTPIGLYTLAPYAAQYAAQYSCDPLPRMMRADNPDDGLGGPPQIQQFFAHTSRLEQRYQALLDSTTPYTYHRWGATAGLLVLFMLRIVLSQGWYIVCYALFIYLLNLFLAFLTPKFDPSYEADLAEQDVEEGEPGLPTSSSGKALGGSGGSGGGLMSGVFGSSLNGQSGDDEFRPFIRRLPEFKFWLSATQAVVISLFCTTSEAFDIPVFWPILLMYFCILFTITMRRQIK
ncbi:Rer1-domain-containing protein [Testicularia cyperi]|uniref:Rer1-domain-containing protein n=1 Tax=Testicularia cyperi TaxID=1882483 RepID=A0A317XQN6_9BASI|nr:Rer1-domain-containing protein [Testicularia cyperi]